MKKYIAEAFGTFTLTLVVSLSLAGSLSFITPFFAVLTVGLFIYVIGPISGSHINPAVTVGLWSIKKISSREAVIYIIAQSIGAALSYFAFFLIKGNGIHIAFALLNSSTVFLAELTGMFFYGFFIAAVAYGKTPDSLGGFIIASALLLGIIIASLLGSAGIINPAVAFGLGVFNIMYVIGPLLGSVLGMQAYRYLKS